ncbi:MAG: chromate transporter, partial [Clostridia bacterium]|nr:chromate transporter [Clostridia bacterium]
MKTFLLLIWDFLKTGAFAIGGGLATIPFLREISENRKWFTDQELMDFIAISESTPGPIAINMATFIGMSQGGILGALLS